MVSDEEHTLPNKHLEHLEDSIFDGRRIAVAAIKDTLLCRKVSVKWDGAPAIVFGTNPDNGKFFVGTKSVFNKVRVKINYTQEDIDQNHTGNVADILRLCLHHLPRIDGIVQADYIGVGGGRSYTPNTITYRFDSPIDRDIILAPHTRYTEVSPTAKATIGVKLESALGTHFVDTTNASFRRQNNTKLIAEILALIPFCKVAHAAECKKHVNKFIRAGNVPSAGVLYTTLPAKYKQEVNVTTFQVWHKLFQLKQRLLDAIVVNGNVDCYIDGNPTNHEGFVTVSSNPYKLVDRLTFSKANFNLSKNW
tara:strand:- start:667 stop:1587 length:921 start_codon:yes stop_codon:yes gene_type:complete